MGQANQRVVFGMGKNTFPVYRPGPNFPDPFRLPGNNASETKSPLRFNQRKGDRELSMHEGPQNRPFSPSLFAPKGHYFLPGSAARGKMKKGGPGSATFSSLEGQP
jgi:hypothetical protein